MLPVIIDLKVLICYSEFFQYMCIFASQRVVVSLTMGIKQRIIANNLEQCCFDSLVKSVVVFTPLLVCCTIILLIPALPFWRCCGTICLFCWVFCVWILLHSDSNMIVLQFLPTSGAWIRHWVRNADLTHCVRSKILNISTISIYFFRYTNATYNKRINITVFTEGYCRCKYFDLN